MIIYNQLQRMRVNMMDELTSFLVDLVVKAQTLTLLSWLQLRL